MINRLSYLYTQARGQHTQWHPSSLSNAARNGTVHGGSRTHTQVNTAKHTVLICSLALSLSLSQTHIYRLSQYLIQLGNARGEAELIITSVFNSSVTGGCCFTVSKAHVNKRAELFKTGDWLARAGSPSHTQIQTCWDNLRKKCLCLSRCKQSKTKPSRSAYHAAGVVNSRDVPADSGVWWSCEEAHVASTRLRGDVGDVYGMTEEFCAAYDQMGMKEENKNKK